MSKQDMVNELKQVEDQLRTLRFTIRGAVRQLEKEIKLGDEK